MIRSVGPDPSRGPDSSRDPDPSTGADLRGVTWVMHDHPLGAWGTTGLPGGPPAYQGHHRPSRGTTELPRDITYLSAPPQACQEHHRPSRGTSQGHHLSSRGTTRLRHHGVVRGTTVPSRGTSAPQACQRHHRLIRGTTGLAGAPQV